MKKLFCLLSLCLLLMAVLCACVFGQIPTSTPTEAPHVCAPSEEWSMDLNKHWHECQCGQRFDEVRHTMDGLVCEVCLAKIANKEEQGLLYLWIRDQQSNPIRTQCYDSRGIWLRTYTHEYTYGEDDQILAQKSYADQVIYADRTWDEKGNLLTDKKFDEAGNLTETYRYEHTYDDAGVQIATKTFCNDRLTDSYSLELSSMTAQQIRYEENGNVITSHLTYDRNGKLTQELRYKNDVLTHKIEYAIPYGNRNPWPQKEYVYDEAGNYTLRVYRDDGQLFGIAHRDAQGDPVDYSGRFNAAACAALLGSWSGEMLLDSQTLDSQLPEFQLKARFHLTFDENGVMTVIYTMEKADLRQAIIDATIQLLRQQLGPERSQAELDEMIRSQYYKPMQKYVETAVDEMDLDKMCYIKIRYCYFVENGWLYTADDWQSIPDGSPFTLSGDQLTFTDSEYGLSITLNRGGDAPQAPTKMPEADKQYDAAICAPLFGTWEGTITETSHLNENLSIDITLRLTFREDGTVLVQRIVDPQAYYDYLLAAQIEYIYSDYKWSMNYTREQTDALFAEMGISVESAAKAQLGTLFQAQPQDHYREYYIDEDNYLVIDHISCRISLTETALTFLRYISATENEEFPFTKIA